MTHRLLGSALSGLVGAGLLASHATPAQNTPTPETPVVSSLSEEHLAQTDSFGPPLGFGVTVATVGKTAFVGAPEYVNTIGPLDANGNAIIHGVVEVYESDATGANWTLVDSLTAVDPTLNGSGAVVAVSGDRLAVGSNLIQLYEKRRGKWTPTETIPAAPTSIVFVGNTLVFTNPGVQVYEIGDRCKPRFIQTLKPSSGDTGRFGSQIALKDDLLVIGSPGTFVEPSQPGPAPPGQVYVYSRDGFFSREGLRWHLEQILQSPTGASGSEFGTGVGISRHAIIVGAPGEDNNFDGFSTTEGGEAYVFKKAHGVWAETQEFRTTGGGGEGFNAFGTLIATGGGRVVISAPGADDVFSAAFGPATIFRWEGGMLVQDGLAATANSLGASRDHIIVGTNYDGRGGFFEGAEVLTYPKKSAGAAPDTDD